ncbi:FMN-binding protein [Haloplasma contractile]|uniref:Fumarate reductase flavoprotein subunit n=1 Tax=Haloplasma contractile SSD-17B TaxID=1033810 RepID=U2E7V3_9MOLU|nr:FMN-binding protein [Haloplasma contractile]ERJ11278.1 fumarate reductase flavoprotein subunit [Haloplasma contractile SSD-17B]
MKYSVIVLLSFLSFFLIGCSQQESTFIYNDGTYTAEGDHRELGYEVAEVTIKSDRIEKVVLKRMNAEGNEVNYKEWTGEIFDGEMRPDLNKARLELATIIVDKQITEVDAIQGATISSQEWVKAVNRALEKAER